MNPEQFIPHESDGEYERLQHMGSFELSIGHGYLINEVRYAGGGYDSSMSGPLEGIAKCSLVFKLAPDSLSSSLLYNGQEQSLARYLFFFFQRHNSPKKKSFICPHPLTEVDTLWRFVENNIEMKNVAARLWTTGFPLEQDMDGEPFTDTSENSNTI